jgi:ankyrin repeat protein
VKDKSGFTPLHIAARNGQKKVVELYLTKGADINEKADDGTTALHQAVSRWHQNVAEVLLNRGADINIKNTQGRTALHNAAKAGNKDMVELLIIKGADLNIIDDHGSNPAQLAILNNHKGTVKLLVSKGADIPTIQLAAYTGDLTKVKSFIESGIGVNSQDENGLTSIHAAAGAGQKEIIEFLIREGASFKKDIVPKGLGTPLHYASHGDSIEVAELLLAKGTSPNVKNSTGESPLLLAAAAGNIEVVRLMLASGADVDAGDKRG